MGTVKDDGRGSISERIFERDGMFDREPGLAVQPGPVEVVPPVSEDQNNSAATRGTPTPDPSPQGGGEQQAPAPAGKPTRNKKR